MAKRTTQPPTTRTTLLIPLNQARERVYRQLDKGDEILKMGIKTEDELRQVKVKHRKWKDYTKELLKQIFNTEEVARQFTGIGVGGLSSQRIPFPKKIESLRNDVQWDLERLASIYEKLELYPVTGAAVSQIEEMSPSSDPSLCSASVTIHNYGTINNPQIQQRTVGSSQETITANVSGDIQTLLDQLAQAVENMSSALPERIARQVKQDLMVFTAEATSSTPRKEWWQLSAEGLKKAAADVGEIGKPVIKLAGQIVPLLLAMHQ